MKIVFFGTPEYVLPILKAIHKEFVTGPGKSPISAVVTQSPKPVGRKQIPSYSPVDKWAHEHGIPIYYSANDLIKDPPEATLGILASYGEIIKKEVINLFSQGILVVHPSLLPQYRGASPVPAAIMNGDTITGCSVIKMDEKMDHGPILTQFKEEILPTDTSNILRDRLFAISAEVLTELIPAYIQGKIRLKPQNENEATFTKLMKKEDGFIDLTGDAKPETIDCFIRAMQPWPGAWTLLRLSASEGQAQKRLKLLKSHIEEGRLVLDEVQLEGKEPVTWKQFNEGYKGVQFVK